jgi:hypothetical protein
MKRHIEMNDAKRPVGSEQLKEYLDGHIPYRLASLRFCYRVCNLQKEPHPDYGDELRIGETLSLDEDRPLWLYAVIESGLIYCRVLLEFLGVTRDVQTNTLKNTQKKYKDDVRITDFRLERITPKQAISEFSYATPDQIERALCHVFETANKTVAHLTSGPRLPGTFQSLRLACRVVIDLVLRHLYSPLEGNPLFEHPLSLRPSFLKIDENAALC